MPSEPRRLHGYSVVSRALRLARQLLLPAIVGGASVGGDFGATVRWILVILAVPSLLAAIAQWLAFRFRVSDDELIIDSGVLGRRRRVIPLARVQNIDLEQSLLERLAGVAELRIETASGGRETEAGLSVLALDEAQTLQARLLERRAVLRGRPEAGAAAGVQAAVDATGPGADGGAGRGAEGDTRPGPAPAAAPIGPPRRVLRLSTADLAVAGATSNEAGLIAAGMATLIEIGGDFGGLEWLGRWLDDRFAGGMGVGVTEALLGGLVLVVVFIVLGWIGSVVVTMVRFHGFTLTRHGDDLRREYGLLSRHRTTVPLERVQAVRIEESLLRRPLGLVALKIETAGTGPGQRGDGAAGRAEAYVPIARRGEVGRLLAEVFEDARFDGVELQPVAPVSRRRAFLRLAIPIAAAAAGLAIFLDPRWGWLVLLLGPAWLFAGAQYRARGWARPSGYALVRNGVLTRTSWVVPERKIQTLHLRETPFQRRWDIGTLLIDTAAGGRAARITDVYRDTGSALLVDLARDAESARRRALHHP